MYITVTIYFIDCQIEVSRSLRLDLVFVLDASGSILAENFEAMKRSVQQIVSPLNISNDTSRVAVIVFSVNARIEFSLNRYTDKALLLQAIGNIVYDDGGSTNTAAALQVLRTAVVSELLGVRSSLEAVQVAIVITDGRSSNAGETAMQADQLKTLTDFQVFALGIGDGVVMAELQAIASRSEFVFQITDFTAGEFQRFEQEIARQTCLCRLNKEQKT